MIKETIQIVVCGSVDHGKSTLLGRLLLDTHSLSKEKMQELKNISWGLRKDIEPAFLIDQFLEERQEERTIDTSQVFINTSGKRFCLIDTPGHVEFIKNMMTGATQADSALLVVDAVDGIREQTKRHLALLKLCGITSIAVVINKMDKIEYGRDRFLELCTEVKNVFSKMGLNLVFSAPISGKEGENIARPSRKMNWFKGPTLIDILTFLSPAAKTSKLLPLRLPVQDIYRLDGEDVCVGRIETGCLRTGQDVIVWPSGAPARVILIKNSKIKKRNAGTKENVGIILDGFSTKRGDILYSKNTKPLVTDLFDARVFWLNREPLKINDNFLLRCATQTKKAQIISILSRYDTVTLDIIGGDSSQVCFNELAEVKLKIDSELVAEKFNNVKELGSFVLEDGKGVCCAGVII